MRFPDPFRYRETGEPSFMFEFDLSFISIYLQTQDFLFAFMMSYICAFLLFLAFEAPVGNLEKLLFMRNLKKPSPPTSTEKTKSAECNERSSNGAMPVEVITMPKHHKEKPTSDVTPEDTRNKSYL